MMIETFLGMSRYLSPRHDDDWSDRMHYLYTPNILLAFSVLISWKQFGGRPMECMFPNKFPGSWEQYAENYCWAQNTYFVESDQHVELLKESERGNPERKLSYYQWVPFFLLLQAACFRAPSFVWRYFCNHSGIRIHEVIERAVDSSNVDEKSRKRNIDVLTRHLKKALRFQRRLERRKIVVHKTFRCLNYQYSSGFISSMYLLTKWIYLANVAAQLYLLNYFLMTNKKGWYGYDIVRDIIEGVNWETSGSFPRVSICDFTVRQVANIQKYSVQCVLVINIFNEKIFVLLWFWYFILALSTILSIVGWGVLLLFPCFSRWFISQHLELSALPGFRPSNKKSAVDVAKFVHSYLHRDGIFVLRMLSSHSGVIFTTDLILKLWQAFYGLEELIDSEAESKETEESEERNRYRKKKDKLAFLEDQDFTTTLIPVSPEDDNKSSSSNSSSDGKKL